MTRVNIESIKLLREKTGAGVMDCKNALEEAKGDIEKAKQILRLKGFEIAQRKVDEEARESRIDAYVHHNRKVGVLVEIACQTDFVADNPEFREFMHDISMHIAAMTPVSISKDDMPKELVEEYTRNFQDDVKNKPPHIAEKIIEGKLQKYLYSQKCLLEQKFVNEEKFSGTVSEYLKSKIAKFGENIKIKRFVIFEVGK